MWRSSYGRFLSRYSFKLTTMDKPTFQTGSLLNSSEGLTTSGLMGLVSTVMMGDSSDQVKMASIIAMAIAVAAYGISRGMAKKDA